MMWLLLLLGASSAVLSGLLTGTVRRYALRSSLMDVPNVRSSHSVPVPRGGGVAIVVSALAGLLAVWLGGILQSMDALVIGMALFSVALVGFIDDRRGLSVRVRFAVHWGASGLLLVGVGSAGSGWDIQDLGTALILGLSLVAFVWLVNLYNFMDGIDGIASVQAVCVSSGIILCQLLSGELGRASWLAALIAGSTLGFMIWNWPPARIFMGDAGSGFLGLAIGAMFLVGLRESDLSIHAPLLLMAVFVSDATITLVRRVVSGQKWYEAHRSHAYQRLALRFGSHLQVTGAVLLINVAWLVPLALSSQAFPRFANALVVAGYLPVVLLVVASGAGKCEKEGGGARGRGD